MQHLRLMFSSRPEWCYVSRQVEGGESLFFKEKFASWADNTPMGGGKRLVPFGKRVCFLFSFFSFFLCCFAYRFFSSKKRLLRPSNQRRPMSLSFIPTPIKKKKWWMKAKERLNDGDWWTSLFKKNQLILF